VSGHPDATRVVLEADGGSRGNPGIAGYGAVLRNATTGEILAERWGSIGIATNNVAEYSGLIAGLKAAAELGATEVEVRMDSKLVVEQMAGRWRIKHPGLRTLAAEAATLVSGFTEVRFSWIPRCENCDADALANRAMDGGAQKSAAQTPAVQAPGATGRVGNAPADGMSRTVAQATATTSQAIGSMTAQATGRPQSSAAGSPSAQAAATAGPEVAPAGFLPGTRQDQTLKSLSWQPPSATTGLRLILVRHGVTDLTVERRYSGRGEAVLSSHGQAQAQAAARRIAELVGGTEGQVDAFMTSPLRRCAETASAIAAAIGRTPVAEPDLVECDFGKWEGLTFAEVGERYAEEHSAWLASVEVAPPGGESFRQVGVRVRDWLQRLIKAHPTGLAIAVTHVSPIKLILQEALAASDAFVYRCYLSPTGISIVDFYPDGGIAVRTVNDTAHLAGLDPSG
jgi:ribonuclease H / adenosylcobalamin/alpha-ribazole phosphatase